MGVYVWAIHVSKPETFVPKWGGKAGSLSNTYLGWDIKKIGYHEDRLNLNIHRIKIMASSPMISWQIDGETMEAVTGFTFLGSKITANGDCSQEIKRCLLLGRKAITNLDSILKGKRHYLVDTGPQSQIYGFSSSHVWMWESDHKEGWASKNWCFWTVVLEKTLESPLDYK